MLRDGSIPNIYCGEWLKSNKCLHSLVTLNICSWFPECVILIEWKPRSPFIIKITQLVQRFVLRGVSGRGKWNTIKKISVIRIFINDGDLSDKRDGTHCKLSGAPGTSVHGQTCFLAIPYTCVNWGNTTSTLRRLSLIGFFLRLLAKYQPSKELVHYWQFSYSGCWFTSKITAISFYKILQVVKYIKIFVLFDFYYYYSLNVRK